MLQRVSTAVLAVLLTITLMLPACAEEAYSDHSAQLPAFSVELTEDENGLRLLGTVPELPIDAICVRPMYSWDGTSFSEIRSEDGVYSYDWDLSSHEVDGRQEPLQLTQLCADGAVEPLKSYQQGTLDFFWIRLHVTTENGTYDTAAVPVKRAAPPPVEDAPAFRAEVVVDEEGYGILGTVEVLPPDATVVQPMYAVDGGEYQDLEGCTWVLPEAGTEGDTSQIFIHGWDTPFDQYLTGEITDLQFKLRITTGSGAVYDTQSATVTRALLPPPQEPPAFETYLDTVGQGTMLFGRFDAFTPAIKSIVSLYSLDGDSYCPVNLDIPWGLDYQIDRTGMISLNRQICALPSDEPFRSYLNGKLDQFYVKLCITTWNGETYYTQPSLVSRGDPQPQPVGTVPVASYPSNMLGKDGRLPYYGKVQVTAREGMADDLKHLLPDTLPVVVELLESSSKLFDRGESSCPVTWQLPDELSLTADGSPMLIRNAAAPLVIPAGQEIRMVRGIYQLTEPANFETWYMSTEIRLSINVIPETAKAELALSDQNGELDTSPLSLAFQLKPSGAKAIRYFYYHKGLEDWVEAGELLEQSPVDVYPGISSSTYYDLFFPGESPYRKYLAGELDGFLVGVEIEGGVFDGELHVLNWPHEYTGPIRVPEFEGSGGNRGDAGADNSGGSGSDGGQRPELPDTSPDVPDTSPDVPDTSPDVPDTSPDVPDTSPDVPDINPDVPDRRPPEKLHTSEQPEDRLPKLPDLNPRDLTQPETLPPINNAVTPSDVETDPPGVPQPKESWSPEYLIKHLPDSSEANPSDLTQSETLPPDNAIVVPQDVGLNEPVKELPNNGHTPNTEPPQPDGTVPKDTFVVVHTPPATLPSPNPIPDAVENTTRDTTTSVPVGVMVSIILLGGGGAVVLGMSTASGGKTDFAKLLNALRARFKR